MPAVAKRYIAKNNVTVYLIDAIDLAAKVGMGKRTNTVLQSAFFALAKVLPAEEDLLGLNPAFDIFDEKFPIMSNASTRPPSFVGRNGEVEDCLVSNGCRILGQAKHSIISTDAVIGERATVVDSVLLPGAVVKDGAHVVRAILGENAVVEENVNLGSVDATKDTAVIGNDVVVGKGEN